jgi:hypothetical protein
MMGRTFSVSLVIAGLVSAALVVPAQVASAAPAGTVVTGEVAAGGHPVSGAKVTLYAWPRQAVVAALKPGDRVPLRAIGSALSSNTGRYSISVSNWKGVRASADHGIVNLEALAVRGRSAGLFNFPRILVTTASGAALAVDGQARVPSMVPQQATLGLVHGPALKPGIPPCGVIYKIKSFGKRSAVVGGTYSRVTGVKMHFKYSRTQSSQLGVGVSATGKKGSWSADGTHSTSNTGSEDFGTQKNKVSTLYKTEFKYGLFGVVCRGYLTKATEWAGGATRARTSVPKATSCVRQAAGTKFTKDTTSAWTFSSGVSMGTVIGINLSAQTGYDHDASVEYDFAHTHSLCGKKDNPGGSPGLLVAGLPGG